jgi:ADP-ribose pyrophosphatase
MSAEFRTLASREIYRNRWMKLREDDFERDNGSRGTYSVVDKADFAVIAAVQDGRIHLVEQYRYPVRGRFWEMPQGSWEFDAVDPLELAVAELREETGLRARTMRRVGQLFLACGYSSQSYHVFFATDLEHGDAAPEDSESDLISRSFDLPAFENMLRDGVVKDATTVAAYGLLKLHALV